jgi:UDP-GlcNAc:undecaprenyl-phosphate/decaprenyl-phosphate GlcNAc-1-phosphate transferase
LARRFGLVAKPRADRWHRKPTALFGGVAIYLAFLVSFLLQRPAAIEGDMLLLLCSSGMFLLGLVDDLVRLKPYAKLIGQIVCSAALTTYGMRLQWLPSPALDQALTMFWLVGVTNALNLLDNLDGLAGGIAMIGALFIVHFCHVSGQPGAAMLSASFAGALAGFLIFNFNPASIFMGDCGSLFLGFFLGGVTMVNNQGGLRRDLFGVIGVPVLLLLIPIVDTTFVTLSRKLHGRPVSQGGRDHTSHRLVAIGLSERSAALVLWTLAIAAGGLAVLTRVLAVPVALVLTPVFGLALLFFFIQLGRVKVYEPVTSEGEGRGRALFPTLADFAYKRRIFEVISDLIIVVLAYYAAFLLRFDGAILDRHQQQFLTSLPLLITIQFGAFLLTGLYRGVWRYTSMADVGTLVRSAFLAWILTVAGIAFVYRLENFSRGVLIMDGLLLMFGVVGTRVAFRWLHTEFTRRRGRPDAKRVVIYGAGDAGVLLARELIMNNDRGLVPVGFIDDDPGKQGRTIHGVRVMGPLEVLKQQREGEVDELLISTEKLDPARAAELLAISSAIGLRTRRMRIDIS